MVGYIELNRRVWPVGIRARDEHDDFRRHPRLRSDNAFALVLFLTSPGIAQLHFQSGMLAAREMFGKSYFSLGTVEKATVDQTVIGMLAGNYQSTTPEALASHKTTQPVGFRAHENT